jgi:UDP-2,3-diacylglucosamine pyrophosphatase LpxH
VADVRYVCLSDLHFGAETSILSALRPGTATVDPDATSPALAALVECLRALVRANEDPRPPALILLGDVLELALGDEAVAMSVFSRFVELAFAEDDPIFGDTVYFVPGNHDHHLWEAAREQQFAAYLAARPLDQPIETPWHTSRLFLDPAAPPVESMVMSALFRRHPHLAGVTVRAVYPNLALGSPDGTRCVLLHHGHFVEPLYTAMTKLDSIVFPARTRPREVWELEQENFAWIDFLWSTLGQTGPVGDDVTRVYDLLQDPSAAHRLARSIADRVVVNRPWYEAWLVRLGIRAALAEAARLGSNMERLSTAGPYSDAAQAALAAYLEGPMLAQWRHESRSAVPAAFVFGHTHKPFTKAGLAPAGWPAPVDVYNTGGWVVDTPDHQPSRGASVVVVDDDLDVAAISLYRQMATAGEYKVSVDAATPGPLAERLAQVVDPAAPPWSTFSAAAATLVAEREAALTRIIAAAAAAAS